MANDMEYWVNEQRADLSVMRVTMQAFIIRLISSKPEWAEERLLGLKTTVTGMLGRMQTDPDDPGTQRYKQLVEARGAEFFGELESLLSTVRNMRGESGRN